MKGDLWSAKSRPCIPAAQTFSQKGIKEFSEKRKKKEKFSWTLIPVVNNFTQTVSQWLWFRVLKQLSSSPPLRAWVPSVPVSITWWRKARRHASSKPRKWTFRIFSFLHPRRCMGDDDAIFSRNVVARCLTVQTSSTSIWKKKRAKEVTIFRFCSFSWRSAFVQSAISAREDHQLPFCEKVCAVGMGSKGRPSFRKNASWFFNKKKKLRSIDWP